MLHAFMWIPVQNMSKITQMFGLMYLLSLVMLCNIAWYLSSKKFRFIFMTAGILSVEDVMIIGII